VTYWQKTFRYQVNVLVLVFLCVSLIRCSILISVMTVKVIESFTYINTTHALSRRGSRASKIGIPPKRPYFTKII
jgi:hypothetical protein